MVGYPHDIKGEGIYAYVILKDGVVADSKTDAELRAIVRQKIAAYALPDVIQVLLISPLIIPFNILLSLMISPSFQVSYTFQF